MCELTSVFLTCTIINTKNNTKYEGKIQRIKLDQDIKPLSEFRANATSCLQQVHETKRPIVITQHGKSSAVLIDVQEYEQLIEKLELLQEIRTAESQIEQNLGIPHDVAKQQILEKLRK